MKKACLHTKLTSQGSSLVEVLLAVTLFGVIATIFVGAIIFGQESTSLAGHRVRANMLVDEGMEAVRNLRDNNFANLSNGTHGLSIDTTWGLSGSFDEVDIFTRTITIEEVDADTKQVTVEVTWQQNQQRDGVASATAYFTNWTTPSGPPPSTGPTIRSAVDLAGAQDGRKIDTQGNYAYVTRAGGNPNFAIIDVSNPDAPNVVGSLNITGGATNGVAVSGNYAYVASSSNQKELVVVDISNPSSPFEAGTLNLPGNADGLSVAVDGTTLYLTRVSSAQDEFYSIDITTPTNPTVLDSLSYSGSINDVHILGSYAYLASTNNSAELVVVDISVPGNLSSAGSYNVAGPTDAISISGYNSTIFLGMNGTGIVSIDVSTPGSPALNTSFGSGIINDLDINNNGTRLYAATDTDGAELAIYDITNPAAPTLEDSVAIGSNDDLNGVVFSSVSSLLYATSDATNAEFMIIEP